MWDGKSNTLILFGKMLWKLIQSSNWLNATLRYLFGYPWSYVQLIYVNGQIVWQNQTTKYREEPFLFLLFLEVPVGLQNLSCVSTCMTCRLAQAVLYRDLVSCLIVNGGPFPPNPLPRSPLFKINIIELPCNIIQHSHSSSGDGGRVRKPGSRPRRRHGFLCSH